MNVHKFDGYSTLHNALFHPFHRSKGHPLKTAACIVTNIFLTVISAGTWQLVFWTVNRLDHKRVKVKPAGGSTTPQNIPVTPQNIPVNKPPKTSSASNETAVTKMAFGAEQWKKHFGKDVGVEPKLPDDINQILEEKCPYFPDKTVKETHLLVLIPETVDKELLTLKTFQALIKNPIKGHKAAIGGLVDELVENPKRASLTCVVDQEHNCLPVEPSRWVLILKENIPGTLNRRPSTMVGSFDDNLRKVMNIPYKVGYQNLRVREGMIGILTHFVKTGEPLFNSTYSFCFEQGRGASHLSIGKFEGGQLGSEQIFGNLADPKTGISVMRIL